MILLLLLQVVSFAWDAPAGQVPDGYNVYRSGGVAFEKLNAFPITTTRYTDIDLSPGHYVYRVTAVKKDFTESLPTNEIAVDVPPLPAPTGMLMTCANGDFTLTWSPVPGAKFYFVRGQVGTTQPFVYLDKWESNTITDHVRANMDLWVHPGINDYVGPASHWTAGCPSGGPNLRITSPAAGKVYP